jgi:hypothetical protein
MIELGVITAPKTKVSRSILSKYCIHAYRADSDMLVWAMSKVEVFSALAAAAWLEGYQVNP